MVSLKLFFTALMALATAGVVSAFTTGTSSFSKTTISSRKQINPWQRWTPITSVNAGPATIEAPEVVKEKKETEDPVKDEERKGSEGWFVRLFNDPMNKREFVARCLSEIVGLSDTESFQVMMQAHKHGMAIVIQCHQERAELYRNRLVENGLLCDMVPIDDE